MRILEITGEYYPESSGGTERHVTLIARRAMARGHTVAVLRPSPSNAPDSMWDGIPVLTWPMEVDASAAEIRGDIAPNHLDQFVARVQEFKPDLVHLHTFDRRTSIWHVNALPASVRFVLTLHLLNAVCLRGTLLRFGTIACDGEVRRWRCSACLMQRRGVPLPRMAATAAQLVPFLAPGATRAVRRVRPTLSRLSDRAETVFSLSSGWGHLLEENGVNPDKIVPLIQGASSGKGRESKEGEPIIFGWAGRATRFKGLGDALTALLDLPGNWRLLIASIARTDEEKALEAQHREWSAHDARVIWLGELAPDAMAGFYAGIDIFLAPYRWAEMAPMVVASALGHGVPVIGYALHGVTAMVHDGFNGRLVDPTSSLRDENITPLRDAISAVLNDGRRSLELWRANATWPVSEENMADAVVDRYEQGP